MKDPIGPWWLMPGMVAVLGFCTLVFMAVNTLVTP